MKIEMYQSTDGSLHATRAEYLARMIELRTLEPAKNLVALAVGPAGLNHSEVAGWIVEHAKELRELLNSAVAPQKRKPKTA